MILANFTPDDIEWQHVGIIGTLKAGEVREFDNARGHHIANKFGRRGIIQMQYRDDEVKAKEQSQALWQDFWEDQITRFNQHNEDQKEKGNRYAKPPASLLARAKELGLVLLQPWKIQAQDSSKEMKELKQSNIEQAGIIKTLISQVADLTKAITDKPKINKVSK